MTHVEAGDGHAGVEERHNRVDLSACWSKTPERLTRKKSLPKRARNLSLALHEVDFLEDLLLAVLAEVVFVASLLVVLHVAGI